MKIQFLCRSFLLLLLTFAFSRSHSAITGKDTLKADIIVKSDEPGRLNLALPDGGIMPVPGVLNLQIFRASKDAPNLSDGDGWTYAHHMDLAVWKGRIYAAWNMTLKDEDRPPSKVVYSTSSDGLNWEKPADLFPREWAWACRFYFYLASNNRMLAFCAAKSNNDGKISEDKKSVLLVREIKADHGLGDVYTLVNPLPGTPDSFEDSPDSVFVEACREAATKNILLEQQDYGVFLGANKMEWHAKTPPYKGFYKFGKALCFFHRGDGKLVGMSKMGFVTISADEGKTWSEPSLPPTLTAGAAKVWGQRTDDNNYILAYNPDPKKGKRFPLVMVHGEDGINFNGMRVVHGEYSPLRYPGLYKDLGYQYVRGIPEWSDDHSFNDRQAVWLIYSVNKEDIWISRIPLPYKSEETSFTRENFENKPLGPVVEGWNIYCPKWAPVAVINEPGKPGNQCLELRDSDPVDHAQAQRLIPPTGIMKLKFRVRPMQTHGYLEAALENETGSIALRVLLNPGGTVHLSSPAGLIPLGEHKPGKWMTFSITANSERKQIIVSLDNKQKNTIEMEWKDPGALRKLAFRTGPKFGLMAPCTITEGNDLPEKEAQVFLLDDLKMTFK